MEKNKKIQASLTTAMNMVLIIIFLPPEHLNRMGW